MEVKAILRIAIHFFLFSSWRNRLLNSEKKPEKRFSMNFLDTLGAGDPLSWENTMRNKGSKSSILKACHLGLLS